MNAIRTMEEVKYVEQNQIVTALGMQKACDETQTGTTWGLVRTTVSHWDPSNPSDVYQHRRDG